MNSGQRWPVTGSAAASAQAGPGAAHLPAVHTPLKQSAGAPQPSPRSQPAHEPPQSTSLSLPFFTPSPQLAAAQAPASHTLLAQSALARHSRHCPAPSHLPRLHGAPASVGPSPHTAASQVAFKHSAGGCGQSLAAMQPGSPVLLELPLALTMPVLPTPPLLVPSLVDVLTEDPLVSLSLPVLDPVPPLLPVSLTLTLALAESVTLALADSVTLALAESVTLALAESLALALPVSLTLPVALTLACPVVGVDATLVAAPVSLLPPLPLPAPPLPGSPQPSSPSASTHPARRSTAISRHATGRLPP